MDRPTLQEVIKYFAVYNLILDSGRACYLIVILLNLTVVMNVVLVYVGRYKQYLETLKLVYF